jgi:hypothetical protein
MTLERIAEALELLKRAIREDETTHGRHLPVEPNPYKQLEV